MEMLLRQPELTVSQIKDYIAVPKTSGYRSLHLLVTVLVLLSASVVDVPVEIQIRTVAMISGPARNSRSMTISLFLVVIAAGCRPIVDGLLCVG